MRQVFAVALVLVLTGSVGFSQNQTPDMSITIAPSQVTGAEASIPVMRNEMYVDSRPFVWVGAPPLRGTAVPGLAFGIRAWREGDKARVVVYAMLDDKRAPDGKTQTPIASVGLALGQSVEISETEKWGASRVFVKAVGR